MFFCPSPEIDHTRNLRRNGFIASIGHFLALQRRKNARASFAKCLGAFVLAPLLSLLVAGKQGTRDSLKAQQYDERLEVELVAKMKTASSAAAGHSSRYGIWKRTHLSIFMHSGLHTRQQATPRTCPCSIEAGSRLVLKSGAIMMADGRHARSDLID